MITRRRVVGRLQLVRNVPLHEYDLPANLLRLGEGHIVQPRLDLLAVRLRRDPRGLCGFGDVFGRFYLH